MPNEIQSSQNMQLPGSTDTPTTTGADPVATANTMAAWVKQFKLDGVDVDYEVIFGLGSWLIMNTHLMNRTLVLQMPGLAG